MWLQVWMQNSCTMKNSSSTVDNFRKGAEEKNALTQLRFNTNTSTSAIASAMPSVRHMGSGAVTLMSHT